MVYNFLIDCKMTCFAKFRRGMDRLPVPIHETSSETALQVNWMGDSFLDCDFLNCFSIFVRYSTQIGSGLMFVFV